MRSLLIAFLAMVATATSAAGQILVGRPSSPSEGDLAAWSALLGTPSGALAPIMTSTIVGAPLVSPQLAFRYGHLSAGTDLAELHNFGVTLLLPAGTGATLSITAGAIHPTCDGCDTQLMLSAGGDISLYSSPLGPSSDAGRLTIALNGELGYGKPHDGRLIAGTVGLPLALVLGSGSMKFVPYVTPAFGFGSSSESGSSVSGSRFLLGGGIGLHNRTSIVSVHAGFQQIFITDAKMLFGIGLSVGGR